jgi:hypothetical protein
MLGIFFAPKRCDPVAAHDEERIDGKPAEYAEACMLSHNERGEK